MLKRQHVNGVRGGRRVRTDAVGIEGESRLPVGCRRYHAKARPVLPSCCKEGPDGLAPRKPLPPRRHGVGCVLSEEGHEAVQIMPFPGLEIAAEELLLRGVWREYHGWTVGIGFGKRRARPLESTVD